MRQTSTVLIVACWLLLSAVHAATYYVDYSGGSDAATGTSTSEAWQHCPGDYRATETAVGTSLTAGDTVIFKGNVAYDCTRTNANCITLSWNGSADSPITYDGNSAGTWGTGKAVMTDNHHFYPDGVGTTCFGTTSSRSYLTFRNFEFAELGGSATLPADPGYAITRNLGIGINFAGGANGVTVRDCDFSEIGYYWNEKPMQDSTISGVGIQTIDCNGLTITNCEFTRMALPLEMFAPSTLTNLTIANCRFHNAIKWAVDLAAGGTSAKFGTIAVKDCQFYNFGEFGQGNWTGYGEWPHVDGIFLRCDFQGPQYCTNLDATGINFYNNSFWDTNQIVANGTACIYLAGGTSANIYNNTFQHTVKSRTIFVASPRPAPTTPQTARIYNNTFVEDYQNCIDATDGTSGTLNALLDIRNNIFYDTRTGSSANTLLYFQATPISSNLTLNHNLYQSSNTSGAWFQWDGTGAGGLSFLQSQGYEENGQFADPLFADLSYGTGWQCNLNDLRLQSGSPAISAGTVLGGIFDADRNGVSRGSSPDLGAYQYVAASGEPTNLIWGNVTVHGTAEGK